MNVLVMIPIAGRPGRSRPAGAVPATRPVTPAVATRRSGSPRGTAS